MAASSLHRVRSLAATAATRSATAPPFELEVPSAAEVGDPPFERLEYRLLPHAMSSQHYTERRTARHQRNEQWWLWHDSFGRRIEERTR
jgi:hypothetical protein